MLNGAKNALMNLVSTPTAQSLQRRYTSNSCGSDCQDNNGNAADTYYHDVWHKNIVFHDPKAINNTPPQIMFYSTPWMLNHARDAEAALATKFTIGNPTGENGGFYKQQNVGDTGRGTYLGTLWVSNNIGQPAYNQTAINIANDLIAQHPALEEKLLISGFSVGTVAVVFGLYLCLAGAFSGCCGAVRSRRRPARTPDIETANNNPPTYGEATHGLQSLN